jgi:hypothetical protein
LLASGTTDEASTLGCDARTVHRHAHRLVADGDAKTRFQTSVKAIRRHWV